MFNNLYSVFSHDLGIDLGTANTLIYVRGKGIAIREPSVIAMRKKTKEIIAIGTDAKKMVGKTPPSIITVMPLKEGVISDFDATQAMIGHYIRQVHEGRAFIPPSLARPLVVIGVPSRVTEVERRAVWEAAMVSGAREAYLVEEPVAAALGENVEIFSSNGVMVVDIGGGTTEIAVIALGGVVVGRSLKVAGRDMDEAILHYIRLKQGLLLGDKTVEDLKIHIGSAYKKNLKSKNIKSKTTTIVNAEKNTEIRNNGETSDFSMVSGSSGEMLAIVRGRDIETGLPRSLRITEAEVREALAPVIGQIIQGISEVVEEAPPELITDILEHGIMLTGGGSQLAGLDQLIVEQVHIPVIKSEDPLTSVVRGAGRIAEDPLLLRKIKVYSGAK